MKTWQKVVGGSTLLAIAVVVGVVEYANWRVVPPSPKDLAALSHISNTARQSASSATSNASSNAAATATSNASANGTSGNFAQTTSNSTMNNVVISVVSSNSASTPQAAKVISTISTMLQSGTPSAMDASAFVQQVYGAAGVSLPRTILQQSQVGGMVQGKGQLQAGDMVFFGLDDSNSSSVTFDGVYIGNGQCVALTGHGLRMISLQDPYWGPRFLFGRSVF